jgi:heat shock protein HslJ
MLRFTSFLIVAALGVAACAAPGSAGIDGREFLSVRVMEGDAERPLVEGTRIRLSFRDGDLGASAGCNSLGATYRMDGDLLVVDGGTMTEIGCDEALQAQDDWLFDFLASRPTLALSGSDLSLAGGGAVIELQDREVADPDRPLVGQTWTLDTIMGGEAASSVPGGVEATLDFAADGSVVVNAGCNFGEGRYAIEGDRIRFDGLALTDRACDGPPMLVEAAVLDVLGADAIRIEIDADALMLTAGDAAIGLRAG